MVSMNNKEDFKNLMAELRKVLSGAKVKNIKHFSLHRMLYAM